MSLAIVTSLFDLGKLEGNPHRKSVNHYLRLSKVWMQTFEPLADEIIVYCDPDLADRIPHSMGCDLEGMGAWMNLIKIAEARRENPFYQFNEAKDTPLYGCFQRTKIELLKNACRWVGTTHIAWIDIGIAEVVPLDGAEHLREAVDKLEKAQILTHRPPKKIEDWQTIHQNVSGGFIAGPIGKVEDLCCAFEVVADSLLNERLAPHDETILEHVAWKFPNLIEERRIANHQEIFRSLKPKAKRAKICLNMIVKNESRIIERCLESVAPWIDRYCVVDTGSTDGTQEVIRTFFENKSVPGKVVEDVPFENFSQARNVALNYGREQDCDYLLLCDSDMQLVVDDPTWRERLDHDSYLVKQIAGISYDNVRLLRRDVDARYVGPTHEYLSGGQPPKMLEGLHFIDHAEGSSRGEKFERDERLLREELERRPDDARSMFYLAQTLKDMGRWNDAITWYSERIRAGGWAEEVWYAQYMIALCAKELGDERDMLQEAMKAYELRPWRSEPLHMLARHYREKGRNELATALTVIGERIPFPTQDHLFVEDYAYKHGFKFEKSVAGFYCRSTDLKEQARKACLDLTTDRSAPCWVYDAARRNSVHYARTARECFEGAWWEHVQSDRRDDSDWKATNPSWWQEKGLLFGVIRTVNYKIVDDGSYVIPEEDASVIKTRNFFRDGNNHERDCLIVDSVASSEGRTDFPVQGYEDLRLFRWRDAWWASCTVRDRSEDGRAEIALLELNVKRDHVVVERCVVQRAYGQGLHQKNWMPMVVGEHLMFVYGCDPTIVLLVDHQDLQAREARRTVPRRDLRSLRGGTQVIEFALDGVPAGPEGRGELAPAGPSRPAGRGSGQSPVLGRLMVVHESVDGHGKRIYLHRLVWMNSSFEIELVSDPFVFDHVGIEFCAGLAQVGEELVFSYGYEDREARLMHAPVEAVRGFLKGR